MKPEPSPRRADEPGSPAFAAFGGVDAVAGFRRAHGTGPLAAVRAGDSTDERSDAAAGRPSIDSTGTLSERGSPCMSPAPSMLTPCMTPQVGVVHR